MLQLCLQKATVDSESLCTRLNKKNPRTERGNECQAFILDIALVVCNLMSSASLKECFTVRHFIGSVIIKTSVRNQHTRHTTNCEAQNNCQLLIFIAINICELKNCRQNQICPQAQGRKMILMSTSDNWMFFFNDAIYTVFISLQLSNPLDAQRRTLVSLHI